MRKDNEQDNDLMEFRFNGGKAQKQDRKTKFINKQVRVSTLTYVINDKGKA